MGRTALHVACRLEHVPLTKLILDMKDVNLDARMAVSQTPKHTTSTTRCVLCTDCHNVCGHGWGCGLQGTKATPLHLVSYVGHMELVSMLVEAGADVNALNKVQLALLCACGWLAGWLANPCTVSTPER